VDAAVGLLATTFTRKGSSTAMDQYFGSAVPATMSWKKKFPLMSSWKKDGTLKSPMISSRRCLMLNPELYDIKRSVAETVDKTLLGFNGDGRLIGCEGKTIPIDSNDFVDWDYCHNCPICLYCFMRISHLLAGGKV